MLQETLEQAARTFMARGGLLVEGVFQPDLLKALRDEFDLYLAMPAEQLAPISCSVGDRRIMVSIALRGAFASPELYGNPKLLPLLAALLGEDYVLDSCVAVCALPGAGAQHVHADHPPLFGNDFLDALLPPFGVTLVIPLRDIDLTCGTTAVWEGSHRSLDSAGRLARLSQSWDHARATLPATKVGDCYLMDYRLIHAGTPNRSMEPRTLLYLVYTRPWFRDAVNFSAQAPLRMGPVEKEHVPDQLRGLFRFM